MAFFAQVPQSPGDRLAEQLGQSLGLGIGQNIGRQQQQQQQAQLAKLLFGQQGQDFSGLPAEQQLEAAKLQQQRQIADMQLSQKVQAQEKKSQLLSSLFGGDQQGDGVEGQSQQPKLQQLSDEQLAALSLEDPQTARLLQQQKEARRKEELKSADIARKEQIEFHRESQKFDEKLSESSEGASRRLRAIDQQRKLIPKLNTKDRIISSLFGGTKYENLLKSNNAQQFDSLVLPMLEGMRQLFGVRLTDADLRLVLQKIATSEKNPEANKAILDWQEFEAKMDIERKKVADQIRKENKGLRPIDYQQKINEETDKKFGNQMEVEARKIMSLGDNPEDLAKITERKKVAPGTPLDTKSIDLYLKIADNDIEKAKKLAKEDGYQF